MIRCNLSILLAERNLKISRVAHDTKISRTTLTSLASNRSQGVQLETINTLCSYLRVTPDEIISYFPINIEITYHPESQTDIVGIFGKKFLGTVYFDIKEDASNAIQGYELPITIESVRESVLIGPEEEGEILHALLVIYGPEKFIHYLDAIPVPFINDIKKSIFDKVDKEHNLSTGCEDVLSTILFSLNEKEI